MILVVILLILVVFVLAVWGATAAASNGATSATALTLATTNAALQTIVVLLACALVAALPLMLFAFWRLGAWRAELDAARIARHKQTPRIIAIVRGANGAGPDPMLGAGQATIVLPAPSRSRTHRAAKRTRQAAQIAKRWFV